MAINIDLRNTSAQRVINAANADEFVNTKMGTCVVYSRPISDSDVYKLKTNAKKFLALFGVEMQLEKVSIMVEARDPNYERKMQQNVDADFKVKHTYFHHLSKALCQHDKYADKLYMQFEFSEHSKTSFKSAWLCNGEPLSIAMEAFLEGIKKPKETSVENSFMVSLGNIKAIGSKSFCEPIFNELAKQ